MLFYITLNYNFLPKFILLSIKCPVKAINGFCATDVQQSVVKDKNVVLDKMLSTFILVSLNRSGIFLLDNVVRLGSR